MTTINTTANISVSVSVSVSGLKFFREEENLNFCPFGSGMYNAGMTMENNIAIFHEDGRIIYVSRETGDVIGIDSDQWWSPETGYFQYFNSELEYKIWEYSHLESLSDNSYDNYDSNDSNDTCLCDVYASWNEVWGCENGKIRFLEYSLLSEGYVSEKNKKYIKFLIKHGDNAPWFVKNHKVFIGSMPMSDSDAEYFPYGTLSQPREEEVTEEEVECLLVEWTLNDFPIGELLSA